MVRGEARTKRNTNMEWPVEDAGRRRAETKDCHTANIVWDEDEDVADADEPVLFLFLRPEDDVTAVFETAA